jgi:hypothetical protein
MSEPTGELDYQIEKRGGVTIPWLFGPCIVLVVFVLAHH